MLAWAGQGVAMGNASARVQAAADRVTATNDDHGVALVIEQVVAEADGGRPAG
jgi:hydroxymethylpyrimidine pyrophosphatase-like HAD family hydrolase